MHQGITYSTDYGCKVDVQLTRMQRRAFPHAQGRSGRISLSEAPVLTAHVPARVIRLAREKGSGHTRMAWLERDDIAIGLTLVNVAGHYSATLFDLGADAGRELAAAVTCPVSPLQ